MQPLEGIVQTPGYLPESALLRPFLLLPEPDQPEASVYPPYPDRSEVLCLFPRQSHPEAVHFLPEPNRPQLFLLLPEPDQPEASVYPPYPDRSEMLCLVLQ